MDTTQPEAILMSPLKDETVLSVAGIIHGFVVTAKYQALYIFKLYRCHGHCPTHLINV